MSASCCFSIEIEGLISRCLLVSNQRDENVCLVHTTTVAAYVGSVRARYWRDFGFVPGGLLGVGTVISHSGLRHLIFAWRGLGSNGTDTYGPKFCCTLKGLSIARSSANSTFKHVDRSPCGFCPFLRVLFCFIRVAFATESELYRRPRKHLPYS